MTIQNFLIMLLILRFRQQSLLILLVGGLATALNVALYDARYVNAALLSYLQAATIPVGRSFVRQHNC